MSEELENQATSGFDFLTNYVTFVQTFAKTNMKSIITSSLVWGIQKVNPYKKYKPDKYVAGYTISPDVYEAVNSLLTTYSDALNDILLSPVFLNLPMENKLVASGVKGAISRMVMELLFNSDPDYSLAVVYFVSHAGGEALTDIIMEKMTTTAPPVNEGENTEPLA